MNIEQELIAMGISNTSAAREVLRKAEEWDRAIAEYGNPEADKQESLKEIIEHYLTQMDQACGVAGEKAEENDFLQQALFQMNETLQRQITKTATLLAERDNIAAECSQLDKQVDSLRTERDELAALVERQQKALIDLTQACADGIGDDGNVVLKVHHEPWQAAAQVITLPSVAALADLKARIRREALKEAAKHFDDCWSRVAAKLRRMAGEGK